MNLTTPAFALTAVCLLVAGCGGAGATTVQEPPVTDTTPRTTPPDPGGSEYAVRCADFVRRAAYLDDSGGLMGNRWEHASLGMPVTVLQIQSVPQVFLYVNTPPVSDRGEPHTGEHLLLGKGARGKLLAIGQDMSLVESTAYTSQSDVVYAWNCAAGRDTFFRSVDAYLEALLLPDYTDEEVRREVCHLGVGRDQATGALELEEKGTIYNEMVSSYEKRWVVWNRFKSRLWGGGHPLAMSSGGDPEFVRRMEPDHIHAFHRAHYTLSANVGMIVALPDTVPEEAFLAHLSGAIERLRGIDELRERPTAVAKIPPARPQEDRSLELVPFPNANEDDGGVALLAWAPVSLGTQRERVLADVFCGTVGSGQTATLYRRIMDSSSREVEVDASSLSMWLDVTKVDEACFVGLDGYPRRRADEATVSKLVAVIADEISRVAGLAPGSDELAAFNDKALVTLTEWEKDLRKQLSSPPLFGHRSSGGFWLDHLRLLDRDDAFERVVTLGPLFAEIRAELAAGKNPWGGVVARLGLADRPYVSISVASREELERREAEKRARIAGYERDLMARYGKDDPQAAIAAYLAEYEAETAKIDARDGSLERPRLVPDVPLDNDPSLVLDPAVVVGVPGFRAVFDNMTFVECSLSLRLEGVRPEHFVWLPVLPAVLTSSGVIEDGVGVPYDEVQRRRSREIYSLSADYSVRPSRGRHELRITAMGADADEARRAVDWMQASLERPWVREDNLARMRDLVSRAIRGTRAALGGREESWVNDPAAALGYQDDPLFLATSSLHVALFDLARLEWQLMDPPGEHAAEVQAFLDGLRAGNDLASTAAALDEKLAGVPETGAGAWIRPIGSRIREMVADMAPASVEKDLRDLARIASADLAVAPGDALAAFEELRLSLLDSARARFVLTGSSANLDGVTPRLEGLLLGFTRSGAALPAAPQCAPLIDRRLRDHQPQGPEPVHYGLVHQAGTSGVLVLRSETPGLSDLGDDALLDALAVAALGGQGPHGFFMRTWGAGLAYSNGISASAQSERVRYYAERCPGLVETMKFVVGLSSEVAAAQDDYLAEYAVAQTVRRSRASDRYESRARALADEIVDGDTPQVVRAWRSAVLALRDRPDLWAAIRGRIESAAGRVLPGLGPRSRDVEGGVFLTIAPEHLLADWEEWVRSHEGADERVYRIYGRDFWPVDTGR